MLAQLRRSAVLCLVCLVIFGLAYPLLGVGLSQLFFKHQADGSITANGSTSIGQNWSDTTCPGHPLGSCVFQGRPDDLGPYASATLSPAEHPGDDPLVANGAAGESGATALGPRSAELEKYTKQLISYWRTRGVNPTSDLVTTSGSGIDPDITPQDATAEIPMVAQATGLSRSTLAHLISQQTQGADLGFLGSPYLDVLQLNEALAHLET
jgi:K+-transporting ATPase ATPase C chain